MAAGERAEYLLKSCVCRAASTLIRKQPFIAELDGSNVEQLRKKSLAEGVVCEDKVPESLPKGRSNSSSRVLLQTTRTAW